MIATAKVELPGWFWSLHLDPWVCSMTADCQHACAAQYLKEKQAQTSQRHIYNHRITTIGSRADMCTQYSYPQ
jgi:hypothetical protein